MLEDLRAQHRYLGSVAHTSIERRYECSIHAPPSLWKVVYTFDEHVQVNCFIYSKTNILLIFITIVVTKESFTFYSTAWH
jgi:hypothetical protein